MAGYTEKQRDALKRAIASGALTVESPDTGRITYRSLAEMRQALAMIERDLAGQQNNATRRRRTRAIVMSGSGGW